MIRRHRGRGRAVTKSDRRARAATDAVRAALALAVLVLATTGCQTFSSRQAESIYGPSEGILETVAVLRRHVPDDTYRFPPAVDFTGRNVYRATLLRLESLESAEAQALRTGYMDAVVLFAKARALERLRAYDLAAQHYRESARLGAELRDEAISSAAICDRLAGAVAIGMDLRDPLAESSGPLSLDAAALRRDLDERVARLSLLESELEGSHYQWIAQEEIERADRARAAYFVATRNVHPEGTLVALQELQRVASRHGASKLRLRHLLDLAEFYVVLAREYVAAVPPASLDFDPARFAEISNAAIRLFELVASHDGRPEKLEATRQLEAFLALGLGIDADRVER